VISTNPPGDHALLIGKTHTRTGSILTGRTVIYPIIDMVIYPIIDNVDGQPARQSDGGDQARHLCEERLGTSPAISPTSSRSTGTGVSIGSTWRT